MKLSTNIIDSSTRELLKHSDLLMNWWNPSSTLKKKKKRIPLFWLADVLTSWCMSQMHVLLISFCTWKIKYQDAAWSVQGKTLQNGQAASLEWSMVSPDRSHNDDGN